jgi:hypothetical protein
MAGITVSTSIKLLANARKIACHKKDLKLSFDLFSDKMLSIFKYFIILQTLY